MFQSNNLFALHAYYLVSIQQSLLFKLVSFFKQNGKNWFLTKGMPSVVGTQYITSPSGKQIFKVMSTVKP